MVGKKKKDAASNKIQNKAIKIQNETRPDQKQIAPEGGGLLEAVANMGFPATNVHHHGPKNMALSFFLILSITIILGWLLTIMKVVLMPAALAVFIAFLLDPAVKFLVSKKIPRPLSLILVWCAAALIGWLLGGFLIQTLLSFRDGFAGYEKRIENLIIDIRNFKELRLGFIDPAQIQAAINRISIGSIISSTLSSLMNFLGYFILTLMFTAYFLPALSVFPEKIKKSFHGERGATLSEAVVTIGRQIQSYMWAKILTSVVTGVLVGAVCFAFGVDFAITWGVLAAFLNFVPNLGAILSCLLPFTIAWLQFGGTRPFWLLGALTIVSMVTGNWMEPKILGKSVNLSPVASLIALFVWGWLWGAVGMIIALPATAMIKFTCDNIEDLKPIGALLGN